MQDWLSQTVVRTEPETENRKHTPEANARTFKNGDCIRVRWRPTPTPQKGRKTARDKRTRTHTSIHTHARTRTHAYMQLRRPDLYWAVPQRKHASLARQQSWSLKCAMAKRCGVLHVSTMHDFCMGHWMFYSFAALLCLLLFADNSKFSKIFVDFSGQHNSWFSWRWQSCCGSSFGSATQKGKTMQKTNGETQSMLKAWQENFWLHPKLIYSPGDPVKDIHILLLYTGTMRNCMPWSRTRFN